MINGREKKKKHSATNAFYNFTFLGLNCYLAVTMLAVWRGNLSSVKLAMSNSEN